MNLKSVLGVSYRVKDVDATASLHQELGFCAGKKDEVKEITILIPMGNAWYCFRRSEI